MSGLQLDMGYTDGEAIVSASLASLLGVPDAKFAHCKNLNESLCAFTQQATAADQAGTFQVPTTASRRGGRLALSRTHLAWLIYGCLCVAWRFRCWCTTPWPMCAHRPCACPSPRPTMPSTTVRTTSTTRYFSKRQPDRACTCLWCVRRGCGGLGRAGVGPCQRPGLQRDARPLHARLPGR